MSQSYTYVFIFKQLFTEVPTYEAVRLRSAVFNFVFDDSFAPRSAFRFFHESFDTHIDVINFAFFSALKSYVFIFEETKSLSVKVVFTFVHRLIQTPPFVEFFKLDHLTTVKFQHGVRTCTNQLTVHLFRFFNVRVDVLRDHAQRCR
ncbi:hypothetical protein D3C87_1392470 [compost metagenome]